LLTIRSLQRGRVIGAIQGRTPNVGGLTDRLGRRPYAGLGACHSLRPTPQSQLRASCSTPLQTNETEAPRKIQLTSVAPVSSSACVDELIASQAPAAAGRTPESVAVENMHQMQYMRRAPIRREGATVQHFRGLGIPDPCLHRGGRCRPDFYAWNPLQGFGLSVRQVVRHT